LYLEVGLQYLAHVFVHEVGLVILQLLQYFDSSQVPQVHDERVYSVGLELLSMRQYDIEALERNLNGLVVLRAEEVDVVPDDVDVLVEVEDEGGVTRMGQVGEDVADLSADVVAVSVEELQHAFEEGLAGEDGLHLRAAAGCDVGDHPAGFTAHYFFVVFEHAFDGGEQAGCEEFVGVVDGAGGDVAEDADAGDEEAHGGVLEVADDLGDYFRLYYDLDFVLVGVGVVADRPAGVRDYLFVEEAALGDGSAEDGDCVFYELVFGQGAASAEVAERPASVFNECLILGPIHNLNQIDQSSCPDNGVPIEYAIRADISDGPDCLFEYAGVVGLEQIDEERNAPLVNNALALDGGAGGDVGECPGGFELQLRVFVLFDVLDHSRY
jgi:hypothetical protein